MGASHRMLRLAAAVVACAAIGCGSMGARSRAGVPESPLERAHRLVTIGCHACLGEAIETYDREWQTGRTSEAMRVQMALAYTLMAFRERELGLPASSAGTRAVEMAGPRSIPPAVLASVLDVLGDENGGYGRYSRIGSDATSALARLLEEPSTRSLPAAYAFATLSCGSTEPHRLSSAASAWLAAMRERSAVLRYAALGCDGPAFEEADELLQLDSRFIEVRYVEGVEALGGGRLRSANEQLGQAAVALPQSVRVTLALADVRLAMARFDEALRLYQQAHAAGGQSVALLGAAKALTYLERHEEAVAILDHLLDDTAWNPGDKYYWRAWNLHQLADDASAQRDIRRALVLWPAPHVHRLAGLAALALGHHQDARAHFVAALALADDECESRLFLAQLDSHDKAWAAALEGLDAAGACFSAAVEELQAVPAASVGEVPPAGEIQRLEQWRASSWYSAAISARVLGKRELALDYAKRVLQDPRLGELARDFILDIDVPPPAEPSSLLEREPPKLPPGI